MINLSLNFLTHTIPVLEIVYLRIHVALTVNGTENMKMMAIMKIMMELQRRREERIGRAGRKMKGVGLFTEG